MARSRAADPYPDARAKFETATGIQAGATNGVVATLCDVLVLAVKPHVIPDVLAELKPLLAKLNENRKVIQIVETDEDLFRAVEATPGAVGLVDVYAINSSVKVLRVDGKLPFDAGYALKAN